MERLCFLHSTDLPQIVGRVAKVAGVKVEELMRAGRTQRIAHARFCCYYMAYDLGMSYKEIGRFFGCDHTSVIHGVRSIQALPPAEWGLFMKRYDAVSYEGA